MCSNYTCKVLLIWYFISHLCLTLELIFTFCFGAIDNICARRAMYIGLDNEPQVSTEICRRLRGVCSHVMSGSSLLVVHTCRYIIQFFTGAKFAQGTANTSEESWKLIKTKYPLYIKARNYSRFSRTYLRGKYPHYISLMSFWNALILVLRTTCFMHIFWSFFTVPRRFKLVVPYFLCIRSFFRLHHIH